MTALGEEVLAFFESAQHDAIIVAPFIRTGALERLFMHIPSGTQTRVVTRWRPVDLLAGVADLGVYDAAVARGADVFLRNDLHAKFFAADERCLVGSANVTDTALGWRSPENLELLVALPRSNPEVVRFEERLFGHAVRATVAVRDRLAAFLDNYQASQVPFGALTLDTEGQLQTDWIPRLRNPEELFSVYNGSTDIGRGALRAMREDLRQLGIAPGMTEGIFREWVAAAISQTPLIQMVGQHIDQKGEVTESDVAAFLREFNIDSKMFRPRVVLENLERWLTLFLPEQYETASESIKLIRAQVVSPRREDSS